MAGAMQNLSRRRTGIFLLNLLYFLALLGLGILLFLQGQTGAAYLVVIGCLVLYLLLVRPMTKRYVKLVRQEILNGTLGEVLEDFTYQEKSGVTARQVQDSGLIPTTSPKSFYSREHITGRQGDILVEAADVTFPIQEGKLNAMFSGCYICLTWPGVTLPELTVHRSEHSGLSLPHKQKELLDQLCSYIPGNLYLSMHGERAELLLRGRFLGFRINPLMPVEEGCLKESPLPELELALRLMRQMNRGTGSRT